MAARAASGPAPAKRSTKARQQAASAGWSMGTRCLPSGRKTWVRVRLLWRQRHDRIPNLTVRESGVTCFACYSGMQSNGQNKRHSSVHIFSFFSLSSFSFLFLLVSSPFFFFAGLLVYFQGKKLLQKIINTQIMSAIDVKRGMSAGVGVGGE